MATHLPASVSPAEESRSASEASDGLASDDFDSVSSQSPETEPSLAPQRRLLDHMRDTIRVMHYSIRTEQSYMDWVRRFVRFHGMRHPREMGAPEITAFLTHLAVHGNVTASTQGQAKSAILFLYQRVLGVEVDWLAQHVLPKGFRRARNFGFHKHRRSSRAPRLSGDAPGRTYRRSSAP